MKKLIFILMVGSLIISCGSISSTTLYPASNQTSNEFISQRNLFIDKQNLSDGFANEEIVEYTSSECGDGWCNGNETSQTCPEDCNRNVAGCTDESACNYNPDATEDDGSCIYAEEGFDCEDGSLDIGISNFPYNYNIFSTYPNPFNPVTNITYGLPEHVNVQIIVYDLSGKQVETLINQFQTPGYHSVNWDADNLPSGVYLIRMDSGDFTQTQKVVLVK